MKSGELAKDKNLLLKATLADAINLGLTKMTESCPGTTYAKLAWLQAWHIREYRPHQPEMWQQPRTDLLHPRRRPLRAVSYQCGQCRRA